MTQPAASAADRPPAIRVASVPADHPYVAHLSALDAGPGDPGQPAGSGFVDDGYDEPRVIRLPDPPVVGEDGSTRWWPPRMLEVEWLRDHASEFDVLHVHFGFESFAPEQLRDVVDTAHTLGKGVVVTVHDLRNPHIADEDAQLSRLDALVPAADAVITLTQGAAQVIRERWGRDAVVIAHPHVVPLEMMAGLHADRRRGEGEASESAVDGVVALRVETDAADGHEGNAPCFDLASTVGSAGSSRSSGGDESAAQSPDEPRRRRIGLHLKSLRPNVDTAGALDALALVANERPDAQIVVTLHRTVTDPSDRGYDAAVVDRAEALAARGAITLVLHEPMDDATLFAHVAGLDVSVMANVWGTHSGWIEMCHDLGVRVVAPNIGFYGEQHEPSLYELAASEVTPTGAEAIDPRRLADAVVTAIDDTATRGRPAPASVGARRAERLAVARAHGQIYREALTQRR